MLTPENVFRNVAGNSFRIPGGPDFGGNAGVGSDAEVLTWEIASGAEVLSVVIAAAGLRF